MDRRLVETWRLYQGKLVESSCLVLVVSLKLLKLVASCCRLILRLRTVLAITIHVDVKQKPRVRPL